MKVYTHCFPPYSRRARAFFFQSHELGERTVKHVPTLRKEVVGFVMAADELLASIVKVPFSPATEALDSLRDWRQHTLTLERAHQCLIPSVFHLHGRPIKKFYRSWRTARKLAKVPEQLFHDPAQQRPELRP